MSLREAASAEAAKAEREYERLEDIAAFLYPKLDDLRAALHEIGHLPQPQEGIMSGTTTLKLSEAELAELREAVKLREADLERARKYVADKGLSTSDVEEHQRLLKGDGPTRPGIKSKLGFRDEPDPDQTDIEDEIEKNGGRS